MTSAAASTAKSTASFQKGKENRDTHTHTHTHDKHRGSKSKEINATYRYFAPSYLHAASREELKCKKTQTAQSLVGQGFS